MNSASAIALQRQMGRQIGQQPQFGRGQWALLLPRPQVPEPDRADATDPRRRVRVCARVLPRTDAAEAVRCPAAPPPSTPAGRGPAARCARRDRPACRAVVRSTRWLRAYAQASPSRAAMTALTAYTTTIGTTSRQVVVVRDGACGACFAPRPPRRRRRSDPAAPGGPTRRHGNRVGRRPRAAPIRAGHAPCRASPSIDIAAPFITVAAPHHGFTRWSPAARTVLARAERLRAPRRPRPASQPAPRPPHRRCAVRERQTTVGRSGQHQ